MNETVKYDDKPRRREKLMENLPKYLNEKEVSEITGIALPTLRNARFNRRGIPHYKVGRSVRYSLEDVVDFMESRKIIPKGTA
jgi:predicted DNA-binding transcriptional regulator AlpA